MEGVPQGSLLFYKEIQMAKVPHESIPKKATSEHSFKGSTDKEIPKDQGFHRSKSNGGEAYDHSVKKELQIKGKGY